MRGVVLTCVLASACGYTGRARVHLSEGLLEGRVSASPQGSVITLPDGRLIPLDTRGINMFRERRAGRKGASYGASILGGVGAIAGMVFFIYVAETDDNQNTDGGDAFKAGFVIGGLAGAGFGALIGLPIGGSFTYWERVPPRK